MKIEHIALYVNDLQKTRSFFMKYLGAKSNEGYHNLQTNFRSGSFLERLRAGVYGNLPGGRTCRTGNRLYQRLVYQETINGMTPE